MKQALKKSVYAVFDIGKTNKKLILFDEDQQIIDEDANLSAQRSATPIRFP